VKQSATKLRDNITSGRRGQSARWCLRLLVPSRPG